MANSYVARDITDDISSTVPTSIQYLTNKDLTIIIYPKNITDAIVEPLSGDKLSTILKSFFRSVTTIGERDKIPVDARGTNMLVRVNDDGTGNVKYYRWDSSKMSWDEEVFPVEEKEFNVDDIEEIVRNLYWNDMKIPSNMQQDKRIIEMAFGPASEYDTRYRQYATNPMGGSLKDDCIYITEDTQRIYKGTNTIGGKYVSVVSQMPNPKVAVEDTLYILRNSKEFYMAILNSEKTGYDKLVDIGVGTDETNNGTFLPI